MDNNILTILTEADREEIKLALKNTIIEQIKKDFEEADTYLFDNSMVDDLMEEAMEDVKFKIMPLLEKKVMKELKLKLKI